MRKSGLCLTLLFSLIASIKSVQAEAIMISGKLVLICLPSRLIPARAILLHSSTIIQLLLQVLATHAM